MQTIYTLANDDIPFDDALYKKILFMADAAQAQTKASYFEPPFIKLPKSGTPCPYSGLSRSKLNQLILPRKENNQRPQVRSVRLRKPYQKKGTRLIYWPSLYNYLLRHQI